jgi:hypothetical protein
MSLLDNSHRLSNIQQLPIKPYHDLTEHRLQLGHPNTHYIHQRLLILAAECESREDRKSSRDHLERAGWLLEIVAVKVHEYLFDQTVVLLTLACEEDHL